jgi:D-alanyl-D-alanine carboxypeptidase
MGIAHKKTFLRNIILFALIFVFTLPQMTSFAQAAYENSDFDEMSYMLAEAGSGQVLSEHDATRKVYPASTTKLMTALLLVEQKGLEGETTVGTEINGLPNGSSLMNIEVGETVSIKDLLYGLMLSSGNDAACTIGVYVSGSVDAFVDLMNQRAAELGMENTHFVTPYGCFINQDEEGSIPEDILGIYHYTTASDMAKLAVEVSKHPEILEAGATETYVLSATNSHSEEREIENSNPLMHVLKNHPEYGEFYYEYATGLKTGTVNNIRPEGEEEIISSYGSVVASADKDGLSLIALIFGDESERETDNGTQRSYKRWQLAADLFDFGFENYAWVDLGQYIQPVSLTRPVDTEENEGIQAGTFSVGSQNDAAVEAVLLDSASADGLENGTLKLEEEIDIQGALPYYVQVGDTVGTVEYMLDGSPVYSADLVVTGQTLSEGEEESGLADGPSSADEALPGWFWWVIIPAAAVGVLFLVRAVNLSRRSHYRRRRYRRPRH